MKYTALVAFGALLVVGVGLWWLALYGTRPDRPNRACAQIITMARNPQTGEEATFSTSCDVPEGWDIMEQRGNDVYSEGEAVIQRFRNEEFGIGFSYREKPDGYTLVELPRESGESNQLLAAYTIMNTDAYQALMASTEPREGPPAIVIQMYGNEKQQLAGEWLEANATLANYHLKSSSVRTEEVGGAPAVRYSFDGLYQNEVIVVAHKGFIFVFSGAFDSFEDPIRRDFLSLVSALTFF